jgi:hypothetical protein
MSNLKYGDKIRALVIGQGKNDFEEARHLKCKNYAIFEARNLKSVKKCGITIHG